MAARLPHALPRRPTATTISTLTTSPSTAATAASRTTTPTAPSGRRAFSHTPSRHADIIRRPRRPYQFTQIIQLSDGSTYTQRTCSPMGLYKSTKDTRNHVLWQPNDKNLRNVEVDEAGKLAAFRERFGRGFDLGDGATPASAAADQEGGEAEQQGESGGDQGEGKANVVDLHDLISGYSSTFKPPKQFESAKDANKKKK